jgi:hypothetical protein
MKTHLLLGALATLAALGGCKKHDHAHADHAHAHDHGGHVHTAPHGGVLVELGDHAYNLEFVVQPDAGRLLMYVLSGHADQFVRSAMGSVDLWIMDGEQSRTLALKPMANPITGETVGNTSLYSAEADWLKRGAPFSGVIQSVSIGGARFEGIRFAVPGAAPGSGGSL